MRKSVDSIMFMHVSYYSETQKICHKAAEKDSKMLKFVPDYFKTHEKCKKVVGTYPFLLMHITYCSKTQKMCEKAVDSCPLC